MNLKQRFSFYFSLLFWTILGIVLISVYFLFSNFREEEFRERLAQRAQTTVKFLGGVNGLNLKTLKIFERKRLNKLFNEKTSVYNDQLALIYTSNSARYFNWAQLDFEKIPEQGVYFARKDKYEIAAIQATANNKTYYVVTSAQDSYELSKLNYLKFLLILPFLLGAVSVWFLSFYLSKKSLQPLDQFKNEILEITGNNLQKRVAVGSNKDEISQISMAFNQVMDRIDQSYQQQKEFTANASHELRTPLVRITSQLQNLSQTKGLNPEIRNSHLRVLRDTHHLSDILTSLLLLSEIESEGFPKRSVKIRLDEVIFNVVEDFTALHSDLKFNFDIEDQSEGAVGIEIPGDEILFKMIFTNLIKNGYLYSTDKVLNCRIVCMSDSITIVFSNRGKAIQVDPSSLLDTFTRGSNAVGITGSGVGLSLVKRILQYHNAHLSYCVTPDKQHELSIKFNRE